MKHTIPPPSELVPAMLQLIVDATQWLDVATGLRFMSGEMLHTCLLQLDIMAEGLISGMRTSCSEPLTASTLKQCLWPCRCLQYARDT